MTQAEAAAFRRCGFSLPVVVTIRCTWTPAFCRELTGRPPEALEPAIPIATWRGIIGMGVDWMGRTLATGLSSARTMGRLEQTQTHPELVKSRLHSAGTLFRKTFCSAGKRRRPTSLVGWTRGCWRAPGRWWGSTGRTTAESRAPRLASRPRSSFWLLSSQLWSVWTPCGPPAETHGETDAKKEKKEKKQKEYRVTEHWPCIFRNVFLYFFSSRTLTVTYIHLWTDFFTLMIQNSPNVKSKTNIKQNCATKFNN